MTKKISIICDKCQASIEDMRNGIWTVAFESGSLSALNNTMHFCSYHCMWDYFSDRVKPMVEKDRNEA